MRISRFTSFLSLFILLSFTFALPQSVEAQNNLTEADTIRFTLPQESEFLPGEAGMPDELKALIDSVEINQRDFDRLLVVGTYDEMGWSPKACDVAGSIPLEDNYEARQDQCDAEVAKWRAIRATQYMIDQRWVNAWKVQPRLLLDERERGIVLIFVNDRTEERLTALEERMEQLDRGKLDQVENRLEKLKDWFNQLEQDVAENQSAIAENSARIDSAQETAQNAQALAEAANNKAEQSDGGPEVGVIVGAGAGRFAGINSFIGEVGLRLGSAEIIAWAGGKYNIGTADLPDRGVTSINRETYGARLNWYPINLFNRLEIGPSLAFEHAEDVLKGREEFVRVHESSQIGVAGKLRLTDWLFIHGGARYLTGYKTESSDLKIDPFSQSKLTGSVSINVRLF